MLLARLALLALLVSTATQAEPGPAQIGGFGVEGQAGVFGSRVTVGGEFGYHAFSEASLLSWQEKALIHGGAYGIRIDDSLFIGKPFVVAGMVLEPYLGLVLSLNSIVGGALWVTPGAMLNVFLGAQRRLEVSAAALLPLNAIPGGTGAAVDVRFFLANEGFYFGVQTQLLPQNPFVVAAFGWAVTN